MIGKIRYTKTDIGSLVSNDYYIKFDMYRAQIFPKENGFYWIIQNSDGIVLNVGEVVNVKEAQRQIKSRFKEMGLNFIRKARSTTNESN